MSGPLPTGRRKRAPPGTSEMILTSLSDHSPLADCNTARDGGLTADRDEVSDSHVARNAALRRDQAMPPNADVVRDLHKIVDLGPLADDRIPNRTAVDGGVGADFHVVLNDDAPGLRNLHVPLGPRQVAESVLADAGTRSARSPGRR